LDGQATWLLPACAAIGPGFLGARLRRTRYADNYKEKLKTYVTRWRPDCSKRRRSAGRRKIHKIAGPRGGHQPSLRDPKGGGSRLFVKIHKAQNSGPKGGLQPGLTGPKSGGSKQM